ncbi:MAG: hypothetical protein MRERV_52c002 [Mycoplasmataceae bacterium RV_VA103A]|nr:MAG: hypothetical protein MRERV_52c002 [Mycoplasmataceae bacterium RV_VA103A]
MTCWSLVLPNNWKIKFLILLFLKAKDFLNY